MFVHIDTHPEDPDEGSHERGELTDFVKHRHGLPCFQPDTEETQEILNRLGESFGRLLDVLAERKLLDMPEILRILNLKENDEVSYQLSPEGW